MIKFVLTLFRCALNHSKFVHGGNERLSFSTTFTWQASGFVCLFGALCQFIHHTCSERSATAGKNRLLGEGRAGELLPRLWFSGMFPDGPWVVGGRWSSPRK